MANQAKLTITVKASRGSSTVKYSTNGRYISLITNALSNLLQSQPLFSTANPAAFWGAVLDVVEQDITGHT